jgi:membrane-associated phospholipid phosphatase
VAFVGATVLWYELWDEHPVLSCSGFAVASAVGVLRLTNRRHWVSDVLAGAGIGMLATSVVYYFEPLKRWQPFSKPDKLALMPYYDGAQAGVTLTFKL